MEQFAVNKFARDVEQARVWMKTPSDEALIE
jgi:hypothetical protein